MSDKSSTFVLVEKPLRVRYDFLSREKCYLEGIRPFVVPLDESNRFRLLGKAGKIRPVQFCRLRQSLEESGEQCGIRIVSNGLRENLGALVSPILRRDIWQGFECVRKTLFALNPASAGILKSKFCRIHCSEEECLRGCVIDSGS